MNSTTFDEMVAAVDKPVIIKENGNTFWRKEDPEIDPVSGAVIKGGMFAHQRKWWDSKAFIKVLVGGYGCIAGETLIYNPVTGKEETAERLAEVGQPIQVLSLLPNRGDYTSMSFQAMEEATAPFVKGEDHLYRVTLEDGKNVTVTKDHKFLTMKGWKPLRELQIGEVVGCARGEWKRISSFEYVRFDKFYDLTVPGPANYLAQGIWHHNSGKSFSMGKRLIASALQNAPCPVASVSPTFPMARKTMVLTLQQLLAGKQTLYGNQFWWKYNKSVHEFIIRFKGRTGKIMILSGENPDSLKGPNLAAAGMDEPFLMQEAVLDQMMARVRHPDAVQRELVLTGTPEMGFGYDLCFGEKYERLQKAGVQVEMIQASTRANLALGRDYIARLEGTFTDKASQAYIDGAFVNLSEGLVYYGFSGMGGYSVKAEPSIPAGATLICGMDFNVNPMAAVVGWKYGEHVHYFDEIELPNADTEYMCQVLREKYVDWKDERNVLRTRFRISEQYNPHYALREIYPDASGNKRASSAPGGKSDFTFIRQAGFEVKCKEANPARKDRYNSVNGKFKPRSGPPTLTVEPSCKRLIRYLQTYSHELMNTEDQKKMSHLLDAFGYPIAFLYPIHHERLYVHSLTGH